MENTIARDGLRPLESRTIYSSSLLYAYDERLLVMVNRIEKWSFSSNCVPKPDAERGHELGVLGFGATGPQKTYTRRDR